MHYDLSSSGTLRGGSQAVQPCHLSGELNSGVAQLGVHGRLKVLLGVLEAGPARSFPLCVIIVVASPGTG